MFRLARLVIALVLVVSVAVGIHPSAPNLLPTLPKAQATAVSISLTGCFFIAGTCTSSGWNGTTTKPNPTITVQQGDTISLSLRSADFAIHQFLLDVDRDGVLDTADCPIVDPCSTQFGGTTIMYTFTVSFAPGTYTYFCTFHPSTMVGSFVVVPSTVGGVTVPVDKLGLLAPYIGLAALILGAIAATVLIYLRRVGRKIA